MSEEDGETADSLDIKPPQARVAQSGSSRMKQRDAHDGRSRRRRSERHRDDRSHSHREKHRREKHKSAKSRESYSRQKEHYYREQMSYKDSYAELQYYREHKEGLARSSRYSEYHRKEKREVHDAREPRYVEKHYRREKYVEDKWEKPAGDKGLEDLREHLLSRHSTKGDEDQYRSETEGHKECKKQEQREDKLTDEERVEQELRRERLLKAGET